MVILCSKELFKKLIEINRKIKSVKRYIKETGYGRIEFTRVA
jgi:hypothetical protein